jgi:amino acid transporter
LYVVWKLLKKTKILPLDEVPIRDALDEIARNPEEKIPPPKGWERLNILWG